MQLEAQLRLCQSCVWWCKSGLRQLSQSYARRKAANYYELLGVKSDASVEEIKNAFFNKSKKLHPDRDPSNPTLHSQFVELNEAYRVLSKDMTRKEYDVKIRRSYSGAQNFRSSTSGYTAYKASSHRPEPDNNKRYWEQFHQYQANQTAEASGRRKKRNLLVVGYCFLTILFSIGFHFLFFRELEKVHTNFMDEKDRVITEFLKDSKERASVNGFKKQFEILKKKQAEFLEKCNIQDSGRNE